MLALAGLVTSGVLLALILGRRASPLVALVLVPVALLELDTDDAHRSRDPSHP